MKKFLHLIIIAVVSFVAMFSLSGCNSEVAVVDDTPYVGTYYYYYNGYPYRYYYHYSYPRYRTWYYRPHVTPPPPKPRPHVTPPPRPQRPSTFNHNPGGHMPQHGGGNHGGPTHNNGSRR